MAAKKIYDAAVKTGEYTTKEGNTKGKWLNVGVVLQYDNGGMGLLLERTFNPAGLQDNGRSSVSISFFETKYNDEKPKAPQGNSNTQQRNSSSTQKNNVDFEDDIPF
jgi:hypothetical protein